MSPSLNKGLLQALRRLDSILSWSALIAGASGMFVLSILIVTDVSLRYIFNSPITGAQDISILALILIVAAAIPYAARSGMHVFVEILESALGRLGCRITSLLARVLGCGMITALTWKLILGAQEAEEFAESTPVLELSYGPYYLVLAAGFGLYALIIGLEAILLLFLPAIPTLDVGTQSKEQS